MVHQYLWTLAVVLIGAGLMVRLLSSREQEPRPVPIEPRRTRADDTEGDC